MSHFLTFIKMTDINADTYATNYIYTIEVVKKFLWIKMHDMQDKLMFMLKLLKYIITLINHPKNR